MSFWTGIFCLTKTSSYKHQLIAIVHKVFAAFDTCPSLEAHSIFLDLSEAIDRVWHKSHPHKLSNNRKDDKLLSLIEPFLQNRYQRAPLNGQSSK